MRSKTCRAHESNNHKNKITNNQILVGEVHRQHMLMVAADAQSIKNLDFFNQQILMKIKFNNK